MDYPENRDKELDELLRQVDEVLNQETGPDQEPTVYANYSNNYGRDLRNYNNHYGQEEEAQPVIPAYNADSYHDSARWRDTDRPKAARAPKAPKPKRRRHGFLKFLLVLAVLLAAGYGLLRLWIAPPRSDAALAGHKSGAATILLCGTDLGGTRTDTMMLLYLCPSEGALNLVSLPRDTLTRTHSGGNDIKLNAAYGINNGGTEGMEALLEYVADLIGYPPDGYMLVDLESFVDVVDLMGGVEFDVPFDMDHVGETDLTTFQIPQGLQRLDGHDALGLVRYRHGYLTQDLGRVEMQQEFISACIDQWLNWSNLSKLPEALRTIQADAVTDLSAGNLVWLGLSAWKTGLSRIQSATLPGYWDGDISYYVLQPEEVADTVNTYCNPYHQPFTADDFRIYTQ